MSQEETDDKEYQRLAGLILAAVKKTDGQNVSTDDLATAIGDITFGENNAFTIKVGVSKSEANSLKFALARDLGVGPITPETLAAYLKTNAQASHPFFSALGDRLDAMVKQTEKTLAQTEVKKDKTTPVPNPPKPESEAKKRPEPKPAPQPIEIDYGLSDVQHLIRDKGDLVRGNLRNDNAEKQVEAFAAKMKIDGVAKDGDLTRDEIVVLQKALNKMGANLAVDGKIGKFTLGAMEALAEGKLKPLEIEQQKNTPGVTTPGEDKSVRPRIAPIAVEKKPADKSALETNEAMILNGDETLPWAEKNQNTRPLAVTEKNASVLVKPSPRTDVPTQTMVTGASNNFGDYERYADAQVNFAIGQFKKGNMTLYSAEGASVLGDAVTLAGEGLKGVSRDGRDFDSDFYDIKLPQTPTVPVLDSQSKSGGYRR